MKLIRVKISEVVEGVIKRWSGIGRHNETFDSREFFQQYGFSSIPPDNSEGLALKDGNRVFLFASDNRTYRIALQKGETIVFTDEGDRIHFKRGKEILIQTGNKLTVEASAEVKITAPTVTIDGDVSVSGTIHADGNITSDGIIADTSGNTNHHSH
jgi:phage baseplate assembly protein V